jgi:PAS domain S-box-containing protein
MTSADSDSRQLLERIAALEADRRLIVDEAQREADSMFAQYQLSQLLATGAGLQELAGMVLVELMRLCEASSGAIWFRGIARDPLRLAAASGGLADARALEQATTLESIVETCGADRGWTVLQLGGEPPLGVLAVAPAGERLDAEGLRVIQLSRHELAVAFRSAGLRETLDRERQELTAIVEGATDAIVQVDESGRVLRVNPAAERLLAIEAGDAAGLRCVDLFDCGRMGSHDPAQCPFLGVLATGEPLTDRTLDVRDSAGQSVRLAGSFAPTPSEPGGPARATAILRDMSAVKALEELREGFVATVSHELRTPLALIRGYTETLLHIDLDSETRHQYTQRILDTSTRLATLVTEILDIAQLNANPVVLERVPVRFESLVARLRGDLAMTGADGRLVAVLPPDLPAVEVDSGRIGQVLENLVMNALKYSPGDRPVTLRASAESRWLVVTVDDEGIGVPEDDRQLVLEPFHRARNVRESATPGTGLGLYIARRLVEAHRGELRVSDRPDGRPGTRVTFTLPLYRPNRATRRRRESRQAASTGGGLVERAGSTEKRAAGGGVGG